MGFSCGLYKVKKFKDYTLNEIRAVEDYFKYQDNEWTKNNYTTWQDYSKSIEHNPGDVSQEALDFYKGEYIDRPNSYSKSIFTSIEDWCSSGHCFHDWFMQNGYKLNDYTAVLTKEDIINALIYCEEQLGSMEFKHVVINRAFTIDEETDVITSIPCNGVEVEDVEGNLKREYTDDWEYSSIYVPEQGYFDEDVYCAFTSLRKALVNILSTTDFETEIVEYNGGW